MEVATRKRPRTVIVSREVVDAAGTFLSQLPDKPKQEMSLREAINQMRDSIQVALVKGYTYYDLAAMLADKGIAISPATLKNYVPSGKRQRKATDSEAPAKGKVLKQADQAETEVAIDVLELAFAEEMEMASEPMGAIADPPNSPARVREKPPVGTPKTSASGRKAESPKTSRTATPASARRGRKAGT